jgi:peroxiredoxin
LQAVLDQITAHGASLVALTPHLADHSKTMIEKNQLGFDMLSDPGNAYAAQLGLRFEVVDPLRSVYAGFGLDIPKFNGDQSWTLPIPGRFVIDRGGIVRAADVDPDYTQRPEPEKTLADLAALG